MVHAFVCAGLNLLLDVESGALHVLENEAFPIALPLLRGASVSDLIKDNSGMDETVVRECAQELLQLKSEGLLDVAETNDEAIGDGGTVKALCLHVAHDCNLRCAYCFAQTGDFDGERALMPFEVGRDALDFLVAHSGSRKHLEVDFFGGEPMMNFDVVRRIVDYGRSLEKVHDKVFNFTMTTNCYDLPEGVAEFCNAQMYNLVLSVDGRPAVHDAVRPNALGKPTHDRIVENAKALLRGRGDKEYYVRGTFTRRNTDFVNDAVYLWDEGFGHISIEPVVLPQSHPLCIRDADLQAVFESYDALLLEVVRRKREGRPHHFFHFTLDLTGGPCLKKRLSGCGAGREYLAVTPDGTLYPCHQFVGREGFVVGNVRDGIENAGLRDHFEKNSIRHKQGCADCFAKYFCSGGCAANAQAHSGNIFEPNPLECAMLKKRTECALALAALDAIEV
jgi:uncharacterized protein